MILKMGLLRKSTLNIAHIVSLNICAILKKIINRRKIFTKHDYEDILKM